MQAALLLWILSLFFLPQLLDIDPESVDLSHRLLSPDRSNLLGSDVQGRDLFARTLASGQHLLKFGMVVTLTAGVAGLLLGIAGAVMRPFGLVAMRATEAISAVPPLLIVLALFAVHGANKTLFAITLATTSIPVIFATVRHQLIWLQTATFVEASRAVGRSNSSVFGCHILPVLIRSVVHLAPGVMISAIVTDSTISFLGLNANPSAATWGGMISESRTFMLDAPWMFFAPAGALVITILLIQQLGRGLIDSLPPDVAFNLPAPPR